MLTLSPTHQTALCAWEQPLSAREDQIHFLAVWLQDHISNHLCDEPGPTSLWSANIDRLEAFLIKAVGLLPDFTPTRAIHALVVTLLYKMGNKNPDFRFDSVCAEILYYQAIIQMSRENIYRFTVMEFFDKLQLLPNVKNVHLDRASLRCMDDMIVRVEYPLPGDGCADAFTQSYLHYLDILGDLAALDVSNDELLPPFDIAVSGPGNVGSVLPVAQNRESGSSEEEEPDSLLVEAGSLQFATESSVRSSLATDLSLGSSWTSIAMTTGQRDDPFDWSTKVMKPRTSVISDETIAAHVQKSDVKNPLSSERPELTRNIFSSFVEVYVNEGTPYPPRKSHLTQGVTVHTRHVRSITPTMPIDGSHPASSDPSSLNEPKFKTSFAASSRRLSRSSGHWQLVKAPEKLERRHCPARAEDPSTKYWRLPLSLKPHARHHLVIKKPANWLKTEQSMHKRR
ncbi:hypothetical protein D9611_001734 [Ephemerocybe angulata]|uniref:Uncharacterized protein n=1 Tax=Ephemerocybe angulata TaxID=980116 RepID=A0A8H5CJJ2_9AGAR|nr:hypothetical protein D9611_001734 [Tulosesus angulatus]